MSKKPLVKLFAILASFAVLAAACGSDSDSDGGSAADTSTASTDGGDDASAAPDEGGDDASAAPDEGGDDAPAGAADLEAMGLWDNGACDESLDQYPVGIITVFESAVLSLGDQVDALEASVTAFNARGGVGGHCMEFHSCDDEFDPNKEVECAQEFVDDGIVATLNDTTSINPQGAIDVFRPAGMPRVGISPNVQGSSGDNTNHFAMGAGGSGTTFVMATACAKLGLTNVGMIILESPNVDTLIPVVEILLAPYDGELVVTAPIPGGTTDFQQFILAMEDAGADCVILPLGENELLQVLNAAEQLDSDLQFSMSAGSAGINQLRDYSFTDRIVINNELPPITASQETWPALAQMTADFEASGKEALEYENTKASPMRSWLSTYAFVKIIEEFGDPDDISREAITAAFDKAADVDMLGLIPAWTPSASPAGRENEDGSPSAFGGISQPWYLIYNYDEASDSILIQDQQVNFLFEFGGVTDYPNP